MVNEKVLVTQALLDANQHIEIEVGDDVHPSQITAPVTQEMLDEDPSLVEQGVKVGDLLGAAPAPTPEPRKFSATIEGEIAADGTLTGTLAGDIDGDVHGTLEGETVTGTFEGTLQPVK